MRKREKKRGGMRGEKRDISFPLLILAKGSKTPLNPSHKIKTKQNKIKKTQTKPVTQNRPTQHLLVDQGIFWSTRTCSSRCQAKLAPSGRPEGLLVDQPPSGRPGDLLVDQTSARIIPDTGDWSLNIKIYIYI